MLQLTPDIETSPPYNQLRQEYADKFSLGNLNTDIKSKFALISLVCYLTFHFKQKKPSVNPYQILQQVNKDIGLPMDFIKGLAVVCEDFGYNCKEFITFNIEPKNTLNTIRDILKTYLPF